MRKPFKRKRIIEIYFVLYLMALILILPGHKDDGGVVDDTSSSNIFDYPYSLKPISNILNAKVLITPDTVEILSMDSINTIYYTGDIDKIDFEFFIKDLSINNQMRLGISKKSSNKYFRIREDLKRQAAIFSWMPPTNDPTDKTYLVTVNAKIKGNNKAEEEVMISTEFSINVDFLTLEDMAKTVTLAADNPINSIDMEYIKSLAQRQSMNTGELIIIPGHEVINTLAAERWTNLLYLNGIDLSSELKKKPEISIEHSDNENGGSATLTLTKDNSIIVEGVAPDYGSNKIKVVVTRYDGKRVETEFPIILRSIGNPKIPKIMYPEITYIIDPKMPALTSLNSYCLLKNNKGNILKKVMGKDKIRFSPSDSDTNTSIYLERYINNRLSDQTHKCKIIGRPSPKITYMQKINKNEYKISTYSIGYYRGRENEVEKLMLTGNADYYPLAGSMQINKKEHSYEQYFMIIPKDKNKPFTFTVQAVSIDGKKSVINKK